MMTWIIAKTGVLLLEYIILSFLPEVSAEMRRRQQLGYQPRTPRRLREHRTIYGHAA